MHRCDNTRVYYRVKTNLNFHYGVHKICRVRNSAYCTTNSYIVAAKTVRCPSCVPIIVIANNFSSIAASIGSIIRGAAITKNRAN